MEKGCRPGASRKQPRGSIECHGKLFLSSTGVKLFVPRALIRSLFNMHVILAQVETITNHSCQEGDLINIVQGKHKHVFASVAGNHVGFATNKTVITTGKSGCSLFDWILSIIGKRSKPNIRAPASMTAFEDCELSSSGSIFGIRDFNCISNNLNI